MSHSFRKPVLSRGQALVLVVALIVHLLVTALTPSRPYFLAPWHMALTAAVAVAALVALIGWGLAKFGVPPRPQVRWRVAFWLLWLALAVSLAPAVFFHLAQANFPPLVRLLSGLVVPTVGVYVLLHLAKVPNPRNIGVELADRDA